MNGETEYMKDKGQLLDLKKAKMLLDMKEYTCVMCKDVDVHTSVLRGVKPIVQWIESGMNFQGYCAADKVVGKATAFLYVLLGVEAIYAHVISKSALEVLQKNNICIQYGTLVEYISNRKGDGICPFESTVLDIDDSNEAYSTIRLKMKEMNITL